MGLLGPNKRDSLRVVVEWPLNYDGIFLGVWLVSKLRAILLMEADFNLMNKEVYGICILEEAHKYELIPEEIFSKKNRMADEGALQKGDSTILSGRPKLLP